MIDSRTFTVDVFRTICDHLTKHAVEWARPQHGVTVDWLREQAGVACQARAADYPFCEVEQWPTYASENVSEVNATLTGTLRVGGPDGGAHHAWAFIEFILINDTNRTSSGVIEFTAARDRLLKLGWKKSAALLIVVDVSADDTVPFPFAETRRLLTPPHRLGIENGAARIGAYDIKNNPADVLSVL